MSIIFSIHVIFQIEAIMQDVDISKAVVLIIVLITQLTALYSRITLSNYFKLKSESITSSLYLWLTSRTILALGLASLWVYIMIYSGFLFSLPNIF
jgi:hypothetical protein